MFNEIFFSPASGYSAKQELFTSMIPGHWFCCFRSCFVQQKQFCLKDFLPGCSAHRGWMYSSVPSHFLQASTRVHPLITSSSGITHSSTQRSPLAIISSPSSLFTRFNSMSETRFNSIPETRFNLIPVIRFNTLSLARFDMESIKI